jgi:hypothetical protein
MMGIMAMFLQTGTGDVAEDILVLTVIRAAAQKLGIDPRSVFLESAREFGLDDTSGLEAYLKRSDEDNPPWATSKARMRTGFASCVRGKKTNCQTKDLFG